MKNLLLATLVLFFAGIAVVNAAAPQASFAVEQDEKTKIKNEELPEAVQTSLKSDSYKDWTISAAYYTKTTEQYEVELKKDDETKTVKFDKEGKELN